MFFKLDKLHSPKLHTHVWRFERRKIGGKKGRGIRGEVENRGNDRKGDGESDIKIQNVAKPLLPNQGLQYPIQTNQKRKMKIFIQSNKIY